MLRRNQVALRINRDPFVVPSASGLRIVGLVEAAEDTLPAAPVIIVVPGLGTTLRQYFVHSWYLLQQGLRVVRYDATCHPGASDGEFTEFTSRSVVEDLQAVRCYVTDTLRPPTWGVAAPSMAFRVALRALREGDTPDLLFAIVGAVNVRSSLAKLMGVDVFQEYAEGRMQHSYTLLGHHGSMRPFVEQALRDDFVTLESAIEDLRRCRFPIVHLAAEKDPWVDPEEVERVYRETEGAQERRLLYLPAVHHDLSKNPVAAALALEQMVVFCAQYVGRRTIQPGDVTHPNFLELVRLNRLELARERAGYWQQEETNGHVPRAAPVAALVTGQDGPASGNGQHSHG
jgi:hypothetical protein